MQRSMFRVRGSFWQFVREHISEPFWGIYNELVHNQPLTLTDANALADSSNRYRVDSYNRCGMVPTGLTGGYGVVC